MYALCVSGAVNTQGFVWISFYALYTNFHSFSDSFIQSFSTAGTVNNVFATLFPTTVGRASCRVHKMLCTFWWWLSSLHLRLQQALHYPTPPPPPLHRKRVMFLWTLSPNSQSVGWRVGVKSPEARKVQRQAAVCRSKCAPE